MKYPYITPTIKIVSINNGLLLAASVPEYDGSFNAREMDELEDLNNWDGWEE